MKFPECEIQLAHMRVIQYSEHHISLKAIQELIQDLLSYMNAISWFDCIYYVPGT